MFVVKDNDYDVMGVIIGGHSGPMYILCHGLLVCGGVYIQHRSL